MLFSKMVRVLRSTLLLLLLLTATMVLCDFPQPEMSHDQTWMNNDGLNKLQNLDFEQQDQSNDAPVVPVQSAEAERALEQEMARDERQTNEQESQDLNDFSKVSFDIKLPPSRLFTKGYTLTMGNMSQDEEPTHQLHDLANHAAPIRSFDELRKARNRFHNFGEQIVDERNRAAMMNTDTYMNEDSTFQCPKSYGHFAAPNGNCSTFYVCREGRATKTVCPGGHLHFNPVTELCDFPTHALCEAKCPHVSGRYPVASDCSKFLECMVGQGKVRNCPGNLHFNAITKQCDPPGKATCQLTCPKYDTLLPLPGRCNMYLDCHKGEGTTKLCPHGLHFSPIQLVCDRPQNALCEPQCPETDGFFPVLGQCNTYLECRSHYPRVNFCPSSLHFNFLVKACDIPEKSGCKLECEKDNGFFGIPGVCSMYVKCLNGIPLLEKCPGDLSFNPVINQCDVVSKEFCQPHCPSDNGIFPVPGHCDLYIRCSHGMAQVKRCPSNLHFNALYKECDTPERAKCQSQCPVPEGVFPLAGKCSMYIRCSNNVSSIQQCPQGLHFNSRTKICDWPASAHCDLSCPELDGIYPVQGNCASYVVCSNGRPLLKTCPRGLHFNFDAKSCDNPQKAKCTPICPLANGIFPLPGYCDSYLHCMEGKPHVDSCPPGLLYNTLIESCDLPENVNCHRTSL